MVFLGNSLKFSWLFVKKPVKKSAHFNDLNSDHNKRRWNHGSLAITYSVYGGSILSIFSHGYPMSLGPTRLTRATGQSFT